MKMKKNDDYQFGISIAENGRQYAGISFHNNRYKFMNNLIADYEMMTSSYIDRVITEVDSVICGTKDEFYFGAAVGILVKMKETLLEDYLELMPEDKRIVTVPTEDVKKMLLDWHSFLKRYENNEIPNLTYNLKKE